MKGHIIYEMKELHDLSLFFLFLLIPPFPLSPFYSLLYIFSILFCPSSKASSAAALLPIKLGTCQWRIQLTCCQHKSPYYNVPPPPISLFSSCYGIRALWQYVIEATRGLMASLIKDCMHFSGYVMKRGSASLWSAGVRKSEVLCSHDIAFLDAWVLLILKGWWPAGYPFRKLPQRIEFKL